MYANPDMLIMIQTRGPVFCYYLVYVQDSVSYYYTFDTTGRGFPER